MGYIIQLNDYNPIGLSTKQTYCTDNILIIPHIPYGQLLLTSANTTYDVTEYTEAKIVDNNLVSNNIKYGVSILGVTGSNKNVIDTSITGLVATDAHILNGYQAFANGTTLVGSMPIYNGDTTTSEVATTLTIEPQNANTYLLTNQHYVNTNLKIMVTSNIDANIQATNIKAGVTILGVAGSYAGDRGYPLVVYTDEEMAALFIPDNIGRIVRFMGQDSSLYDYKRLYEIDQAQLPSPILAQDDNTLIITDPSENATSYTIIVDDSYREDIFARQLDIPSNVVIDNTTATFDAVENATSYKIFVDGVLIGEHEAIQGEQ